MGSSVKPDVPLVETIAAASIYAPKPAETYLVEDAVTVPEVVDLKTESQSSLFFGGGAKVDVLQSSVQPEVPLIDTITAAPKAALKPAEIYLVEEEVTVPDVDDLKTESESSLFFGGSANVGVLQSSVQPETEGHEAETEEPVVETDAPVVKPAETYIVVNEAPLVDTEVPVCNAEAPAETYIVETDAPVVETETLLVKTEVPVVKPVTILAIEAETVLEAINNSVDSEAGKAEHANGYWIEVSGDRDVLVKYHA